MSSAFYDTFCLSFDLWYPFTKLIKDSLRSLPLVRNGASSPLNSKLPADILYKIFIEDSRSSRNKLESQPLNFVARTRFVYKDDGLRITHVCRFWRSAALSCSALWDLIHIPSYSADQIQEYLVRSSSRPLTLYYNVIPVIHRSSVVRNAKVLELLQNHLWRVKELRFSDLRERNTNAQSIRLQLSEPQDSTLMRLLISLPSTSVYSVHNVGRCQSSINVRLTALTVTKHLYDMRLRHDNIKITAYPEGRVVVGSGNFKGEVVSDDPHSTWNILNGLYIFLHQPPSENEFAWYQFFPIQELKSLEISFLHPVFRDFPSEMYLDDYQEHHAIIAQAQSDHMALLEGVISAATTLQSLRIRLTMVPGKEKEVNLFQNKITSILESLRLGTIGDRSLVPELRTISLGGFNLGTGGTTWDKFVKAFSRWNSPGTTLRLDNPRHLTMETARKIAWMVNTLLVDDVEV